MFAMNNKALYIDLSTKDVKTRDIDMDTTKKFIGGSGVGWKLASELIKPNLDPLDPESPVVISVGALVGTLFPGSSKVSAIFKYPILATKDGKHFIGESTSGGRYFGPMIKAAGYDHIVITGKAEKPVYIKIVDEEVEIIDAEDLWGMTIEEVTDKFKGERGDYGVLAIGKAGENKVAYSMACIDKTNSLGRSGLGAVFGSKNLKAIVVRGTHGIKISDPDKFKEVADKVRKKALAWSYRETWLKLGMGAGWSTFKHTQYPGKWSKAKWEELYGEEKRLETAEKIIPCISCVISCRIKWKIKDGEFAGETGFGSPYGKSATSGQLLDIEDHRKMLHMVTIANGYGLDFYTTTRLIDFVTTLYQQGRISKKDTGGLELKRDYETYLKLLEMIVNREGFGDVLADAWMRLYRDYNLDPQEYWYGGICKGVDFIYDARPSTFHPLMMTFFTRPRPHHGGSHTITNTIGRTLDEIKENSIRMGIPPDGITRIFTETPYSPKFNVGRYTKYMEDWMRVKNSTGVCSMYTMFGLIDGVDIAEAYSAATGINFNATELLKCGERISNLAMLLNVREGFSRAEATPPETWFRPMNSPEGKIELMDYFRTKVLTKEDVLKNLDDYYDERGWDKKTGIPTRRKVAELGLPDFGLNLP
ncbi:MAG: aldehyde ferredoxin oxidoreductase N-terminal domain-containing protein [Candidatus Asgardarchaeia archaeon]